HDAKNRGMTFDVEMLPYCGKQFRVLRRVEQILDEKTGQLVRLPNPSILLNDVVCTARYHRFCPRGTYAFWREIWLRRVGVDQEQALTSPASEGALAHRDSSEERREVSVAHQERLSTWRGAKPLLALFDQVLVSGTNFAATVLVGRYCGATELGV